MKKRAIIFGGTGNIGREIMISISPEIEDIIFTYQSNSSTASILEKKIKNCKGVMLDVCNTDEVYNFFQRVLKDNVKIATIVFAVGYLGKKELYSEEDPVLLRKGFIDNIDEQEWNKMLEIMTRGLFNIAQCISKYLRGNSNLNIVIIGAPNGIRLMPAPIHFAASRAAMKGMVETLAKSLGDNDIYINLIAPGILEKGLGEIISLEIKVQYEKHCSMKRVGNCKEIGHFISWFALNNSFISGQSILLDGGL